MARWFEGAEEAAFMPVAGGYLLQLPNRWFVGRPQRYLVSGSQKAAIAAIMRRRRRLVVPLLLAYLALVVPHSFLVLRWSMGPHGPTSLSIAIAIGYIVLTVAALVLAPHYYMMRKPAPLLAGLPPTEQRIKLGDQIRNLLPRPCPTSWLLLGMAARLIRHVMSPWSWPDAVQDGHYALAWGGPALSLLVGGLLTVCAVAALP